jgi:hypothetical protein
MSRSARVKKKKVAFTLLAWVTGVTIFAASGVAGAAPHYWHRRGPGWRGDIRYFHQHDVAVWRGGHWAHGWHVGRFGWWWVVPGGWYLYPSPVYPYPDPYVPPVIAVQPAPPVAQAQPQAQTWYYCDKPAGYYPYVPECSSGWKAVPATPPPTSPGAPPPPVR